MDATQAAPAPQLRPLGVGDIVDRVFSMYRQRALLFAALEGLFGSGGTLEVVARRADPPAA